MKNTYILVLLLIFSLKSYSGNNSLDSSNFHFFFNLDLNQSLTLGSIKVNKKDKAHFFQINSHLGLDKLNNKFIQVNYAYLNIFQSKTSNSKFYAGPAAEFIHGSYREFYVVPWNAWRSETQQSQRLNLGYHLRLEIPLAKGFYFNANSTIPLIRNIYYSEDGYNNPKGFTVKLFPDQLMANMGFCFSF